MLNGSFLTYISVLFMMLFCCVRGTEALSGLTKEVLLSGWLVFWNYSHLVQQIPFAPDMLLWGLNGVSKIPKTHHGAASYAKEKQKKKKNSKVYQLVNNLTYSILLNCPTQFLPI